MKPSRIRTHQPRRILVVVLFTLALAIVSATRVDARPPNIILILADDLGYGHLGCYGQTKIKTPHIDALAKEGMRFTQFYAGGTVCAPSRSVLMTGLHTGHTPIRKNGGASPLRDEDLTLPEVLKGAGYATGGFGKWGLGTETTSGAPTKQGFDHFFGYLHQVHAHFYYTYFLHDDAKLFLLSENEGGKRGAYSHDVILARGLDFIREIKDKPFFAYFPLTLPHVELTVPEDSAKPYRGQFPEAPLPGQPWPGYIGSDEPYATHAGMITRLDDAVGKILAQIHDLNLDENTLILFASDNGPQAGPWSPLVDYFGARGPLHGEKTTLYEGGIRVPFIARWPGRIKPNTTSDFLGGFQDFLPTFAEAASAKAPEKIDGLSFLPTLLGQPQTNTHEFLYWEHFTGNKPTDMIQALRSRQWKLVQPKPGSPFELYNLENDLGETNNLAPKHPEIVEVLKAQATQSHAEPRDDAAGDKKVSFKDYVR